MGRNRNYYNDDYEDAYEDYYDDDYDGFDTDFDDFNEDDYDDFDSNYDAGCDRWNERSAGSYEPEVYVDDQCCRNCRYWCDWDPDESRNGCKDYSREDYVQKPENCWCVDWKDRGAGPGGRKTERMGCKTGRTGGDR